LVSCSNKTQVLPREWKQHDELSGNRMDRVRSSFK